MFKIFMCFHETARATKIRVLGSHQARGLCADLDEITPAAAHGLWARSRAPSRRCAYGHSAALGTHVGAEELPGFQRQCAGFTCSGLFVSAGL